MNKILKSLLIIILLPILATGSYVFFLWATYIDNTVTEGSKYGFTIGTSMEQTYQDILSVKEKYSKLMLYISYGPRAGDNMTVPPTKENFETALSSEFWELLLDGDGEFFNVIRLKSDNNVLTEIYRHRKYFELP
ncbi:MAG: hypothetical protein V7722_05655 [Porticoccus sp.]